MWGVVCLKERRYVDVNEVMLNEQTSCCSESEAGQRTRRTGQGG